MGYIDLAQLAELAEQNAKSDYGAYIRRLVLQSQEQPAATPGGALR